MVNKNKQEWKAKPLLLQIPQKHSKNSLAFALEGLTSCPEIVEIIMLPTPVYKLLGALF